MNVNTHISDLFFNSDLEDCKEYAYNGIGQKFFTGYDEEKLSQEAEFFLRHIDAIVHGSISVPTVEALIADFFNRV